MNSPIHIAVSIDDHYVMPLGVMLTSLFENTSAETNIHVLHTNLNTANVNKLKQYVDSFPNGSIYFHQLRSDKLDALPVTGHLKIQTYFRLLIADELSDIDTVLYMDPDVIILDDIADLWSLQSNQHPIAAVPCITPYDVSNQDFQLGEYFNAGVMLINLSFWRRHRTFDCLLELIRSNPGVIKGSADQDLLNFYFKNEWKILPLDWNVCADYFSWAGKIRYKKLAKISSYQKNRIIHFSGPVKPWQYACPHPARILFDQYKDLSPWNNVPPQGRNIISFISRLLPHSINLLLYRFLAHTQIAANLKSAAFSHAAEQNTCD